MAMAMALIICSDRCYENRHVVPYDLNYLYKYVTFAF